MTKYIGILISPTGERFYDAYGPMSKDRKLATRFVSAKVCKGAAMNRYGRGEQGFWQSERDHFAWAAKEYKNWTSKVEPEV